MTKRIVSGLFILAAVAAISLILAGALNDGEQLVARFLIAVIVAALGLYVISDLRLKADEQANHNAHTKQAIPTPNELGSNTPAFMATVTKKKEQRPDHPFAAPLAGPLAGPVGNPSFDSIFNTDSQPQFPPTQLEAIPLHPLSQAPQVPQPAQLQQPSQTPKTTAATPHLTQRTEPDQDLLNLSTLPPPTFESRSEPTIMLTNRSLATAGTSDTTGFYMADITDANKPSNVDRAADGNPILDASSTGGNIDTPSRSAAIVSGEEPNGVDNQTNASHPANNANPTNAAKTREPATAEQPSVDLRNPAPGVSARPPFDPINTSDSAGWLNPVARNTPPSTVNPTRTADLGRQTTNGIRPSNTSADGPRKANNTAPNSPPNSDHRLHRPPSTQSEHSASRGRVQSGPTPANNQPIRPATPIVHLRRSASAARADDIEAAIKAGEVDIISSLVKDGLLATSGPITDEEVQTLVYVAFTSNELRQILLSDGSVDRPVSRSQVEGVDVIVNNAADMISLAIQEHQVVDLSGRGGGASAPAGQYN